MEADPRYPIPILHSTLLGIGPQALELDGSHSGRIYKKHLAQFGIKSPMYDATRHSRQNHLYIINTTINAIRATEVKIEKEYKKVYLPFFQFNNLQSEPLIANDFSPATRELIERIWNMKPLLENWNKIAEVLEDITLCNVDDMKL
jgi:hypothetical protein